MFENALVPAMDGWTELNGGIPPVLKSYGKNYDDLNQQIRDAAYFEGYQSFDVYDDSNVDRLSETIEADFFRSPNCSFRGNVINENLQDESWFEDDGTWPWKEAQIYDHESLDAYYQDKFTSIGSKNEPSYNRASCMMEDLDYNDHESSQEYTLPQCPTVSRPVYTAEPTFVARPQLKLSVYAQLGGPEDADRKQFEIQVADKQDLENVSLSSRTGDDSNSGASRRNGLLSRLYNSQPLSKVSKKKRPARSSFATQSTTITNDSIARQILTSGKRRRVGSRYFANIVSSEAYGQRNSSDAILGSDCRADFHTSLRSSARTGSSGQPRRSSFKGYPGQFESDTLQHMQALEDLQSPVPVPFGRHWHPNGEFFHTAFSLDPRWNTLDFTRENLDGDIDLFITLMHAEKKLDEAASDAVAALRSRSEENLRREGHLECSTARLEGVPVGVYRYFQGHLTVEEYKDAKMCVCWETCFCNKLCTIYGDMICPCSDAIILQQD